MVNIHISNYCRAFILYNIIFDHTGHSINWYLSLCMASIPQKYNNEVFMLNKDKDINGV